MLRIDDRQEKESVRPSPGQTPIESADVDGALAATDPAPRMGQTTRQTKRVNLRQLFDLSPAGRRDRVACGAESRHSRLFSPGTFSGARLGRRAVAATPECRLPIGCQ
jgi:hypothetical protein